MSAHQRPWTLGAIVAADMFALKASLRERAQADRLSRCWLVVGGEHGYWREERLCLHEDGRWTFAIDSQRAAGTPRPPAHPERIPVLEHHVREIVIKDNLAEGVVHVARSPGLLLLGYDHTVDAMYGLSGYRVVLEAFWDVRVAGRLARGTAPGR